jgi:putative nucleotidyltransferase with HDIG domain
VQRPPVQEIVANSRSLPSLPLVLNRILELINNDNSNVRELESLIKRDQSLSCRVLAAANSAYYGTTQKVETVGRAVVVLGFQKVREFCLGAGLMGLLGRSMSLDEDEAEAMWKHSLATAEAASSVARRSGIVDPELAFTAGLLHDLGKVVLAVYLTETYGPLKGRTWRDAEMVLDLDHQDLGLALAEQWGLPPSLAECMARHHCPDPSLTYAELVAAIHVADCLAGLLDKTGPAIPQPLALDLLGLLPEDTNGCLKELVERHREIEELWENMKRA